MADSTALARYRVTTNGVSIDTRATDFEAQPGITKAEVIGHVNAPDLTNEASPDQGSRNVVELEVTASDTTSAQDAEAAIIAAATAVGDVAIVGRAEAQTGATAGFTLTADAPLLVADNDAPTQAEGGLQVVVTLTCTQKAGGFATITSDVDTVYAGGFGTVVFADGGNDTATITIDTEAGDAALSPFVFTVTATDALGQTVDEVVTLTVTV